MTAKFEIDGIFQITNRGNFISARLINTDLNFQVTDNSRLGEVEVTKWFDIPRAIDNNGRQRMDLFFFKIKNEEDKEKLKKGEIVELTHEEGSA